jgi:hypothetical protein
MVHAGRHARRWGAYAALGIALALLGQPAASGVPQGPKEAVANQTDGTQNQANASNTAVPANAFAPVSAVNAEAEGTQADGADNATQHAKADPIRWTDWIVAISAMVSAIFAGVLAVLTWRLIKVGSYQHRALVRSNISARRSANAARDAANAAVKSANVSERALVELERPYVAVQFTKPGLHAYEDGQMRHDGHFRLNVVNYGRTPAILTELLDTYPTEAGTALPYPLGEPLKGPELPAGTFSAKDGPFEISKNSMEVYDDRVFQPQSFKRFGFWTVGFVRYADIFGNVFVLGYCGKFDPLANRFVLFGGDGLNFTRQEVWAIGEKPKVAD